MNPVRFSRLKLMALSPAHYLSATVDDTRSIELGAAFDHIVFGTRQVVAYPGKVRRGKEFDAFSAEHKDDLVVTQSELAEANAMAEAVFINKHAVEVLTGTNQPELNWKWMGRDCQSHPDVIGPGFEYITDLKSSVSSNPDKFRWQALRMGYFAQLAFYGHAVEFLSGVRPKSYHIVCVESRPPYVVTVYRLTDRALELGRRCCRLWMERLLQCESSKFWPGYSQGVVALDAPDDFEGDDPEPSADDGWSIG